MDPEVNMEITVLMSEVAGRQLDARKYCQLSNKDVQSVTAISVHIC